MENMLKNRKKGLQSWCETLSNKNMTFELSLVERIHTNWEDSEIEMWTLNELYWNFPS